MLSLVRRQHATGGRGTEGDREVRSEVALQMKTNGRAERQAAVEVQNLCKLYTSGEETVRILDGVSFSVEAGQFFAIAGVSGSGKTTLLNIMSGLDVPTSGDVRIFGSAITALNGDRRAAFRRDHLGFIFQFYNLMPMLTAEENVKLVLELLPLSKSERDDRTAHYLSVVGLRGKERRMPGQLSGGEQQRVAIGRALAKEPLLILADEPTGSLDRETGRGIVALMREATEKLGTTVIVVTHDAEISALADGVLNLGARTTRDVRVRVEVS
jgi:putative ABC transport system ATP-binding protein